MILLAGEMLATTHRKPRVCGDDPATAAAYARVTE